MENGILQSTKKVLGLDDEYSVFDLDVVTHINAAFAVLYQLGVGPTEAPVVITGSTEKWEDYSIPAKELSLIRTYIYLKVRMLFDPPGTSFLIKAMNDQIAEYEWRISAFREEDVWEAKLAAEAAEQTT